MLGFPGGSVVKSLLDSAGDSGDMGWTLDWEDPPGEGNGNTLQDSCLVNPMGRGAWWTTFHGVTTLHGGPRTERLSTHILSMLKRTRLCYKTRIERKIFSEDCRDKGRGRVITNHRDFFFFFFCATGMSANKFYYKYPYASKFFYGGF